MANPDNDQTTTINVKSVSRPAWEAARRDAAQRDDSMGTWLSDAISQRLNRDADAVQPPVHPSANLAAKGANPEGLTEDQVTARMMAIAALQQSAAAMKLARVRSTPTLRSAQASLEQMLPAAPPRLTIRGKANGKERPGFGKETLLTGQSIVEGHAE